MLKPISLETDVRLKLSQKIDKKLLKERKSAGQKLTYISANTCIDILNTNKILKNSANKLINQPPVIPNISFIK